MLTSSMDVTGSISPSFTDTTGTSSGSSTQMPNLMNLSTLVNNNESLNIMNLITTVNSTIVQTTPPYVDIPAENENVQDAKSQAQLEYERFANFTVIMYVYVLSAIVLFGVIGNVLSLIVMSKERTSGISGSASTFLLMTLAVADTVFLLSASLYFTLVTIVNHTTWSTSVSFFNGVMLASQYLFVFLAIAQVYSNWVLVVLTFNRFIAVVLPLKAHLVCTKKRVVIAVIFTFLLAVALNIIRAWERKFVLVHISHPKLGDITLVDSQKDLLASTAYNLGYRSTTNAILRVIAPIIILAILNVKLILVVRKGHHRRRTMSKEQPNNAPKEDDITLRIVCVVVVFILCQLPSVFLSIVDTIDTANNNNTSVLSGAFTILYLGISTNILAIINSAVNFIIYFVTGKRFRTTLIAMLCRRCMKKQPRCRNGTMMSSSYSSQTNTTSVTTISTC